VNDVTESILVQVLATLDQGGIPTRRERIATACLAGLLADPQSGEAFNSHGRAPNAENYATAAVMFADALIAELDK
jgi:hypothetical protein